MGSETTTIRAGATLEIASTAWPGARGMSAPDLIGVLVGRAEDEELFASHATAHETLKSEHPGLLQEIEAQDGEWGVRTSRRQSMASDAARSQIAALLLWIVAPR